MTSSEQLEEYFAPKKIEDYEQERQSVLLRMVKTVTNYSEIIRNEMRNRQLI